MCYFMHAALDSPLDPADSEWLPNPITVYSHSGISYLDKQNMTMHVHAPEGYEELVMKTDAFWRFIANNQDSFSHCDWFFKVDTDTVINLPALKNAISCFDPAKPFYSGYFSTRPHLRNVRDGRITRESDKSKEMVKIYYGVGASYFVSKAVVSSLPKYFSTWIPYMYRLYMPDFIGRFTTGEDGAFGMFLHYHGLNYTRLDNMKAGRDTTTTYPSLDFSPDELACKLYAHKVPFEQKQAVYIALTNHTSQCKHFICQKPQDPPIQEN